MEPHREPDPGAEAAEPGAEATTWGFPSFARGFPREPELDALVEAFAAGNYAAVRERAPRLAANTDVAEEVRRAAGVLRERIEPDRSARGLFALTAGLLVFLTVWWVLHDGPGHRGVVPRVEPPKVEYVK